MQDQSLASRTLGRKPIAPRCWFYPTADQSAGAQSPFCSGRSPLPGTAFHSPVPMTRLAACLRYRIDDPGLHLRSRPEISRNPFGSALPALPSFFAWRGSFTALHPLLRPIPTRFVCCRSGTPRQDFSIPPDLSTFPGSSRRVLPLRVARWPSLPAAVE